MPVGIAVVVIAACGTIFYLSHIEEVPITGRRRFNCFSQESAVEEGELLYRMLMEQERQHILPEWDHRVKQVQRVLDRLLPVSGMGDANWEVHVLNQPGIAYT